MHICFLSQYFPPEVNAPAKRLWDNARQWVADGHRVTVLTVFPHHPRGVVPRGYRRKWLMREKREGIEIVRTFVYPARNAGFLRRTLGYITVMISMVLLGPFVIRRPDVLVATSPQFFVAMGGYALSRLMRVPFVFEVRDLWPEAIVGVGAVTNPRVIRVLEGIETGLYRGADRIVVVTRSFSDFIQKRGIDAKKIDIIKNGIMTGDFEVPIDAKRVRDELGFGDAFVVTYVGTHGMMHGLSAVLRAAKLLQDDERIRFLFVGDGAERASLLKLKEELGLSNVMMLPQQPRERAIELLRISNLALVPLRKIEVLKTVLPSKIPEAMAAGIPILLGVQGEAQELVEEVHAGVCVEPENSREMAEAVRSLASDPQRCRQLGENGRKYVRRHMDRTVLARTYERVLEEVVRAEKAGRGPAARKDGGQ